MTAAIFPVGTAIGGCPDAIAEILQTEPSLDVYPVYGNRAAPDAKDTENFVDQIRESVRDSRVTWIQDWAVDPHDFSQTYTKIRTLMAQIAERGYDRVYVGITGGTTMAASLFQSAMAHLHAQVVPMYVQSRGASWQRTFVASNVRDRVTAEEALSSARSGQIRLAARLAERLPLTAPGNFFGLL